MSDNTTIPSSSKAPLPPLTSTVGTKAEVKAAATPALSSDDMMKIVLELKARLDEKSKPEKAKREPVAIDYSKLTEKDIYNMNIPIEVVDQQMPDEMNIKLRDSNYVPRWINKQFKRIAVMLRMGWTYVTKEDFSEEEGPILPFDENGHYSCHDVVAVKIPKARLYPVLRRNYLMAATLKDKNLARASVKKMWDTGIKRGGEELDPRIAIDPALQAAIELGGVEAYDPVLTES